MAISAWSPLDAEARALDEQAVVQGKAKSAIERRCNSAEFCTALELFAAAFAISNRNNELAVLARNDSEGGYVFPIPSSSGTATSAPARPAAVRAAMATGLDLLRGATPPAQEDGWNDPSVPQAAQHAFDSRFSSLSSCICVALLWLNRVRTARPGSRGRILVLQAGQDVPSQYVPTVNATYSAQRAGIPIDSIVVGRAPSVFQQQAAHLTGGVHLQPEPRLHVSLLEYLLMNALPDAVSRRDMRLPPQHAVNMRAHCFCHRRHVTTAWLCTVCLSVWCRPEAPCPTCGSGAAPAAGDAAGSGMVALSGSSGPVR